MVNIDNDLPHADVLDAIRNANPNRMANSMRSQQWEDVFWAHPDVVQDTGETVGEES